MIKLIQNAEVYSPTYIGKKDVLILNDKIEYISEKISAPKELPNIEIINAENMIMVPGFIDGHVHICGGGGEGGFKTRTPEIKLTDITMGGVTTVIGLLGTDGTTRNMKNLIAKARALEEEGISCYILTGSYQVPVRTLSGSIVDDIVLIEIIIGVGEIAISDHRSTHPTIDELLRIVSDSRLGGILSGKSGVVNFHLGDGKEGLNPLYKILEKSEIPIYQFLPTHINRNKKLIMESIPFAKAGGYIDLTTSIISGEDRELSASRVLKELSQNYIDINHITFSSDGQGSLPIFDEKDNYIGLGVGKVTSLYEAVRKAVLEEDVLFEKAIKVITSNVAKIYKLKTKGYIKEQMDADIVLLDKNTLEINTVIAMGQVMIKDKAVIVKGTFES